MKKTLLCLILASAPALAELKSLDYAIAGKSAFEAAYCSALDSGKPNSEARKAELKKIYFRDSEIFLNALGNRKITSDDLYKVAPGIWTATLQEGMSTEYVKGYVFGVASRGADAGLPDIDPANIKESATAWRNASAARYDARNCSLIQ
jgi:hypothetical protein